MGKAGKGNVGTDTREVIIVVPPIENESYEHPVSHGKKQPPALGNHPYLHRRRGIFHEWRCALSVRLRPQLSIVTQRLTHNTQGRNGHKMKSFCFDAAPTTRRTSRPYSVPKYSDDPQMEAQSCIREKTRARRKTAFIRRRVSVGYGGYSWLQQRSSRAQVDGTVDRLAMYRRRR